MPYFVYRVSPGPTDIIKNLEHLGEYEKYRDAKNFARDTRVAEGLTYESDIVIKIIMAENALDAEEKLMEKREKPILQEWEK
jgi:hypothetical protein